MIINVILGVNIDTPMWISNLQKIKADYIAVINYDSINLIEEKDEIIYISSNIAKKYLDQFEKVKYYKSIYIFPEIKNKFIFDKK